MNERFELDCNEEDMMLPGFRFHPTDEELVTFYLRKKVEHRRFPFDIIMDVDIYKYDPWDLPKMVSLGDPKRELYFFCPRDRKYRNSPRPNRITLSGFWKATGTDRYIHSSSGERVGLKKSLVFYLGKAAKSSKTDWMMHEFRLPAPGEGPPNCFKDAVQKFQLEQKDVNWTICKIFKRQPGPGKIQLPSGQYERFNRGEETEPCLADLPVVNPLAPNPVLLELSVTEDLSEEDSKSPSPTSTRPSNLASLCAASHELVRVRTYDERAISLSINPVESESSKPLQRPLTKLHMNTNSANSAMGLPAGEDVWSSLLPPIISPEYYVSGPSCILYAADQAYQDTPSAAQDCWAPHVWSPKSSFSLPLWD